jgi:hypothetical protein
MPLPVVVGALRGGGVFVKGRLPIPRPSIQTFAVLHLVLAPLPALCAFVLIGTIVRAGGLRLPWEFYPSVLTIEGSPPPALTDTIRMAAWVLNPRLGASPYLLPPWVWLTLWAVALSLLAWLGISRSERWGGRVAIGLAALEVAAMTGAFVAHAIWMAIQVDYRWRYRRISFEGGPTLGIGSGVVTLVATAFVIVWGLWVVRFLRDPVVAHALRPLDEREALRGTALLLVAFAIVMVVWNLVFIVYAGLFGIIVAVVILGAFGGIAVSLWRSTSGGVWLARAVTATAVMSLGLAFRHEVDVVSRINGRSLWPMIGVVGPVMAVLCGVLGYLARPGLVRALRLERTRGSILSRGRRSAPHTSN